MTDVRIFNRNKSFFVWLIGIGFFLIYCGFLIFSYLVLTSDDYDFYRLGLFVLGFVIVCGGLIGLRSQTKNETIRMALIGVCIAMVINMCSFLFAFVADWFSQPSWMNIVHIVFNIAFWIVIIGSFAMILQELSRGEKLFHKISIILNIFVLMLLKDIVWAIYDQDNLAILQLTSLINSVLVICFLVYFIQGFRLFLKDERIFPSIERENEINTNIRPRIITAPLIGAICCAVVFVGLSFLYIHYVVPIN